MNLDAVAVELDLVNPALVGWHLVDRCRQRGFDESGVGCFHADCHRLRFKPLLVNSFRDGISLHDPSRKDPATRTGSCARCEACPRFAADRTCGGHVKIDEFDPKATFSRSLLFAKAG